MQLFFTDRGLLAMLAVKLILWGCVMTTSVTAYLSGGGIRAPVCEMAAKGFGQSSSKPAGKSKPGKAEGEQWADYHTKYPYCCSVIRSPRWRIRLSSGLV